MMQQSHVQMFIKLKYLAIGLFSMMLLSGCQKDMEALQLKDPQLPSSPNYAFAAPNKYGVQSDLIAPDWSLTPQELANKTVNYIQNQPRVTTLEEDWDKMHFVFIQKTLVFRFPDQIEVQVVALDENQSSLLMLSRSQYGYYDFGVNKRRVQRWLKEIHTSEE